MKRLFSTLLGVFILFAITATPVSAGHKPGRKMIKMSIECGQRADMLREATEDYGEAIKAVGLYPDKRIMETFVSATGQWTVMITNSKGISCYFAFGKGYQEVPWTPKGVAPDGEAES